MAQLVGKNQRSTYLHVIEGEQQIIDEPGDLSDPTKGDQQQSLTSHPEEKPLPEEDWLSPISSTEEELLPEGSEEEEPLPDCPEEEEPLSDCPEEEELLPERSEEEKVLSKNSEQEELLLKKKSCCLIDLRRTVV